MNAWEQQGCHVLGFDMHPTRLRHTQVAAPYRLMNALNRTIQYLPYIDYADINKKITSSFHEEKFSILFIEKGLSIHKSTLDTVKQMQPDCVIAGYCADDIFNLRTSSLYFQKTIQKYDYFFTTKSHNVGPLIKLGCPEVHHIDNGYEPSVHRPMTLTAEEKDTYGCTVGFVGAWEKPREESLHYMQREGVQDIKVFGPRWRASRLRDSDQLTIQSTYLEGMEYTKAICGAQINLGFLHKGNRDQQTTRSVEIPACGGFLLAERTEEHQELFIEDKEAVYFDSHEELVDKIKFYAQYPERRLKIARAGYERCKNSPYSNADRVEKMRSIIS